MKMDIRVDQIDRPVSNLQNPLTLTSMKTEIPKYTILQAGYTTEVGFTLQLENEIRFLNVHHIAVLSILSIIRS